MFTDVRTRPHTVVALEAVEAGAAVFPLLTGVLSGSAEDGRGVRTDFSHAVFVLTSAALSGLPDFADMPEARLRAALADPRATGGRPLPAEVLERVDRIVRFRPLDGDALGRVLDDRLAARAAASPLPLPSAFATDRVRRAIVRAAAAVSPGNGRAVVRELDDWLARAAAGEDVAAHAAADDTPDTEPRT